MYIKEIESAYDASIDTALKHWSQNPSCGKAIAREYERELLGVSTGELFKPDFEVTQLHQQLLELQGDDERLDVVPYVNLHFTFLALAPHRYLSVAQLPAEIGLLREIYHKELSGFEFVVSELRLVAVKNGLLLAGIPDSKSFERRRALTDRLLNSKWAPYLRRRYGYRKVPPVFWHTTLARYESEFAPVGLRELFHSYCGRKLGEVNLGRPRLVAVTYDWSKIVDIG
jgi:hypothetical protein